MKTPYMKLFFHTRMEPAPYRQGADIPQPQPHQAETGIGRTPPTVHASQPLPTPAQQQALLYPGMHPDAPALPDVSTLLDTFERGDIAQVTRWFPGPSVMPAGTTGDKLWTPLPLAVRLGTPQLVETLRDLGYTVHVSDEAGNNLLLLAMYQEQPDILTALMQPRNGEAGIDPDSHARLDGCTALMVAAGKGNILAMQSLLAAGADPTAIDYAGRDALAYADNGKVTAHNHAVQSILEQAVAARAQELVMLLPHSSTYADDLCAKQAHDVAGSADESAGMDRENAANDTEDCPAVTAVASGETSNLPYQLI